MLPLPVAFMFAVVAVSVPANVMPGAVRTIVPPLLCCRLTALLPVIHELPLLLPEVLLTVTLVAVT